jgi:hypothetical protein
MCQSVAMTQMAHCKPFRQGFTTFYYKSSAILIGIFANNSVKMEIKVLYPKEIIAVLKEKSIKTELYSRAGVGDDKPVAIQVVRIIVREIWRPECGGRSCERLVTKRYL